MCENKSSIIKIVAAVAVFMTTVVVVRKIRKTLAVRKAAEIAAENAATEAYNNSSLAKAASAN